MFGTLDDVFYIYDIFTIYSSRLVVATIVYGIVEATLIDREITICTNYQQAPYSNLLTGYIGRYINFVYYLLTNYNLDINMWSYNCKGLKS